MIVKAIGHRSAKKSSIRKLIKYVFDPEKMRDGDGKELIVKQFLRTYDRDRWADQFRENDEGRNFEHSRRTVLRHEIVSFSPESAPFLNREKLKTITKYYLKNRCPNSLAVATVHYGDNPHVHCIISGVDLGGNSTRVDRKVFQEFKVQLQKFQQKKYPELSHSVVEHNKGISPKISHRESMMERRGTVSEKKSSRTS